MLTSQIEMRTAKGFSRFNIHEGKVIIDGTEVVIPVHVGNLGKGVENFPHLPRTCYFSRFTIIY
ncbi:MAG: hypothetical protein KME64_37705 [Scytonematopsis contorta HA4267-MV1]|nr:hypothetical protein [Scytonematopsis contorta HA4267-MV1]